MPRFKRHEKLKWKHSVVLEVIVSAVVKCVLRYLLMAAYIWTCNKFGLFNHSLIAKAVVWLTSICVSRAVMREIGRIIFGDKTDDELFNTVGIVECIRSIVYAIGMWWLIDEGLWKHRLLFFAVRTWLYIEIWKEMFLYDCFGN